MTLRIVGVDPGGTTGICLLVLDGEARMTPRGFLVYPKVAEVTLREVDANVETSAVRDIVQALIPDVVAVEDWVAMRRAGRLAGYRTGGKRAADIAALWQGNVQHDGDRQREYRVVTHNASRAKKWGSNRRLEAAGIKTSMRHARDAARHALFAAVELGHLEDPLLVQARNRQVQTYRGSQPERHIRGISEDTYVIDEIHWDKP